MTYTAIGSDKTRAARVVWMLEELGVPYDHASVRPASADNLMSRLVCDVDVHQQNDRPTDKHDVIYNTGLSAPSNFPAVSNDV